MLDRGFKCCFMAIFIAIYHTNQNTVQIYVSMVYKICIVCRKVGHNLIVSLKYTSRMQEVNMWVRKGSGITKRSLRQPCGIRDAASNVEGGFDEGRGVEHQWFDQRSQKGHQVPGWLKGVTCTLLRCGADHAALGIFRSLGRPSTSRIFMIDMIRHVHVHHS